MNQPAELYERHLMTQLSAALEDARVVVLNGARQTGKSTLSRWAAEHRPGSEVRYLDDATTRASALADPAAFVRHDGLLVIDEIQRAPELMLAIKHEVDLDTRPGRFLLTGSARLFALHSIPDLLPGRAETLELWPLSQGEITAVPDDFVDRAFSPAGLAPVSSDLDRAAYIALALRGGYPEAVRRADQGRRRRLLESYIADLVRRDLTQVSDIERPADMLRLLRLLAGRVASPLVMAPISSDLALPSSTVKRYIDLLELLFVIRRVPAWSSGQTARATATPKLVFSDSGLAGGLSGLTERRAADPRAPIGPLLENFVIGEVLRQLSWGEEPVTAYHYRNRDNYEVDLVLEHASGEVLGIEVKAAATVRLDDFRGLSHLQSRLGDRFIGGIVLHAGTSTHTFGPKLTAMPISALWTPA